MERKNTKIFSIYLKPFPPLSASRRLPLAKWNIKFGRMFRHKIYILLVRLCISLSSSFMSQHVDKMFQFSEIEMMQTNGRDSNVDFNLVKEFLFF